MAQGPRDIKRPRFGNEPTLKLGESRVAKEDLERSLRAQFHPVLVVMSGPMVGVRTSVSGSLLIGRAPDAELRLDDASVSFHHARIEDRGGAWAVLDLGSTNGTALNGRKLEEGPLENGDKLLFGDTLVRFELQDAADAAFGDELSRLLSVDELSGLFVPRRFNQRLRELLGQAAIAEAPLGMLVLDLDGIKAINDTHGHAFGSYVIGATGHLIGELVGPRAVACRWGGDEFNAALPGLDLDATVAIGEKIRRAVAEHHFVRDS
ncbi:MAG: GGDEF domain-containing protein, partial [Myxococcales bacterium]|nr:GGDEF domain-containing protein [Myxococcales bacterium]